VGAGDVGRVTVKERGTAENVPSTISRSIPGTAFGRSVVVRNGDPRLEPRSWSKSGLEFGSSARGALEDDEENWKKAGRGILRE